MKKNIFKALATFLSIVLFVNILSFDAGTKADSVTDQTTEDFVKRGYELMLGREAEEEGLEYWTNELNLGHLNAAQMISSFSEAPEFLGKEYSNDEIIDIFYRVMLSRESDPDGKAYWLDVLDTGFSTRHIVNGFAGSPEFKNLCSGYGIDAGVVNFVEPRDLSLGTTKFVASCYRNILKRNPDKDGLNYWTSLLISNDIYPEELISEFFYTPEGQQAVNDDASYIDALYLSFLGRAADDAGKAFWLDSLKDGVTKEQIYDQFKDSEEFASILEQHDLTLRPTPTPTPVPTGPMIARTFDDGPYSPVTNRILDQLEVCDGKATFFVVGDRVGTYSSCVSRAFELGCEIANHTYDHKNSLTSISGSMIEWEVGECNNAVFNIIGQYPTIMRPCGGSYNDTTKQYVGMPMIIWNLDTQDWKYRDTEKTVSAILNNVSDGDIILMHDLYPSTAAAMEIVIPELTRRGYQLVTVSELAEAKGIDLEAGEAYLGEG